MASQGNPLAAIAAMLGGGQGDPSQGGGAQGQDDSGAALAQQLSQMRSSNPQMIISTLRSMKQQTAALIAHSADSIPGVARFLASNLRGLDSAIEAATKAYTAQSLAEGPLQMSAAQPAANSDQGGGMY